MTTPTLPVDLVSAVNRVLGVAATPVASPFTGGQDVQDWGGEWWEYSIDVAVRKQAEGRALSAFFAKLRGPVTPFLFCDPAVRQSGSYGTPAVNGASQSGNALVTDGWSSTGLKDGDFFSLGSGLSTEFYQLTADVQPVAGAATLEFVPALRTSPADNALLEVSSPKVLLRLTSPVPAGISPGDLYRFNFTAREAI
jgi:hypothetical protein